MKYGGIVGPLLNSLRKGSGPKPDILLGQEVKTTRNDIKAFVALDAEQNTHLVISPAPESDERFSTVQAAHFSNRDSGLGCRRAEGAEVSRHLLRDRRAGSAASAFRRVLRRFAD